MRHVVVFYRYPWNNKVFNYGVYDTLLHRKEYLVIRKQNLSARKHGLYGKVGFRWHLDVI